MRADEIQVSVVIPAYNEAEAVAQVVRSVRRELDGREISHEIIVVDDGSADGTADRAARAGCRVLRNPTNKGYGYAILRGIDAARSERIAIIDADGTYPAEVLPALIHASEQYDMVVGKREGEHYTGSPWKWLSRGVFRFLVEFTAGTRIPDVNSGLRVFRKAFVQRHRHAISTGYSFTTTITLIALLEGCHLHYEPITYRARRGESKVHWVRDTLRSLQIITEVILLYNPLKFFLLLAAVSFVGAAAAGWLWELTPRTLHPLLGGLFAGGLGAACIFAIGGAAFAMAGQRRLPEPAQSEADAGKLPPLEVPAHAGEMLGNDGPGAESGTPPPGDLGEEAVSASTSSAGALKKPATLGSQTSAVPEVPAGRKRISLDS